MSAYLNQFKRRFAQEKGLANKDNPIDPHGTKALLEQWGLTPNQPWNIYYRNRNEYDSIWFISVMDDPKIGKAIREKINVIVSDNIHVKPDLNVWDMDGNSIMGNPDETLESENWIVTFEKGKGFAYMMRIYKKS